MSQAFISLVTLLALLSTPAALEAKRKKPPPPPLQIVDVTTSPVPFTPGNHSMSMTVEVELPEDLSEVEVLEVSSLISSPSKRVIRFLFSRQRLDHVIMEHGKPRMRATLLWDGKDQFRRYMTEGTYAYEVRAKLMADENGFMKAKMVSRRARGTVEVAWPQQRTNAARDGQPVTTGFTWPGY